MSIAVNHDQLSHMDLYDYIFDGKLFFISTSGSKLEIPTSWAASYNPDPRYRLMTTQEVEDWKGYSAQQDAAEAARTDAAFEARSQDIYIPDPNMAAALDQVKENILTSFLPSIQIGETYPNSPRVSDWNQNYLQSTAFPNFKNQPTEIIDDNRTITNDSPNMAALLLIGAAAFILGGGMK